MQVEVTDDEVFYSWPLHHRGGGCAALYRGMVVQFDGAPAAGKGGGIAAAALAQQQGGAALSMRILGIAKLKCLNYIWRTFGVRNQLSSLLNGGVDTYLNRCRNFFRNWSVPPAHRDKMMRSSRAGPRTSPRAAATAATAAAAAAVVAAAGAGAAARSGASRRRRRRAWMRCGAGAATVAQPCWRTSSTPT